MARRFNELKQRLPGKVRERAERRTNTMLKELPLYELRQARHLSQRELADVLRVQQGSISKMERRTDMYLSTLRRFVEAMGGVLEITARFPDGTIRIESLGEIADEANTADGSANKGQSRI